MKAQLASPGFTPVFAALVAVVNTKLPENGELILKRVIVAFRRAYKRRDKVVATALAKFIAHMVNQQVRKQNVTGRSFFHRGGSLRRCTQSVSMWRSMHNILRRTCLVSLQLVHAL